MRVLLLGAIVRHTEARFLTVTRIGIHHYARLASFSDTATFPGRITARYGSRRRGDRVTITCGKYDGQKGTVESNVHQKSVDYPDELANGFHVMLDTDELVTVRWDQVEATR